MKDNKNKSETHYRSSDKNLNFSEERYKSLIETSPDGIITVNTKGTITSANPAFIELTGYSKEEIVGRYFTKLSTIRLADIPKYLKMFQSTLRGRKPLKFKYSYKRKNGEIHWAEASYGIIKKNGRISEMQIICREITEEKKAEEALKESEEKYRMLVENLTDLIVKTDHKGRYLFVNPSFCSLFGKTEKELIGKIFISLVHKDDRKASYNAYKKVYKPPYTVYHEQRVKTKTGLRWLDWTAKAILDENKNVIEVVGIGRDITNRKESEKKIKYLSFHDKLTNLYNRAYFEEELARLNTPRQLPLSIIMGDLNGLKLINDTFGYSRGDSLLVTISKVLKDICRADDILARWGGDEFVILLPKTTQSDAEEITARIKGKCKEKSTKKMPLSISLGISTKKNPSQDISSILKETEDRMQSAKLLESRSMVRSIIDSIEGLLVEKSNETKLHTERIKDMSEKLGKATGLSAGQMDKLALLATLHDIGKIAIPEEILKKRGALTEKEWDIVKRHPETGYRIASATPELAHIADDILCCHERFNGTGYPHSLKGEDIPILSRIILIVDAYDVMTHDRAYKKAITKNKAIEELKRCSGTQFDPRLIDKFIDMVG